MAVQNTRVQTIVVTSKHEDCNLMFTKPWKRGWNIPSKRDSKAQNKDQRSIVTACTNTYSRIYVFSTLRTQQCNIKMKLNHPSISTEQGNQVSLLPSAPWPLKSLIDNTIREVLKGYRPSSRTNLADLAINKRYSQHDIVLSQLFIMTHQRALCVHLIR